MPDAGKAIADYILNARPSVKTDYIFLTLNYPARKFTDDTGKGDIWNGYTGPAGIKRSAFDRKAFIRSAGEWPQRWSLQESR